MNGNHAMNGPTGDEYVYVEETAYGTGYDPDPASDGIKEVVGAAISGIPGVLALKGGLTDIFKANEDLTRGVSAKKSDGGHVSIGAKVIAESGYDEADLVQQVTEAIADELQAQLGLIADKVEIDVTETLSREEFYDKYDADRALH